MSFREMLKTANMIIFRCKNSYRVWYEHNVAVLRTVERLENKVEHINVFWLSVLFVR